MPKDAEPTILEGTDPSCGEIHSSEIRLLKRTSVRSDRWKVTDRFPDNDAGQRNAHSTMIGHEAAQGGAWRIVRATEEILEKWE